MSTGRLPPPKYSHDIELENPRVDLEIWDHAATESSDHLQAGTYFNSHAIIVCFPVLLRQSFEDVHRKICYSLLSRSPPAPRPPTPPLPSLH